MKERKGISRRSRTLLSRSEGPDVDFKRDIRGVHSEDLVAFANIREGGAILVGVEEISGPRGAQRGRIVGCGIGDQERLQVLNKAQECIPPIAVEVHVENISAKPFMRIEVPPSGSRPHCTSGGVYKVRADGRIRPMRPDDIMSVLLEREAESFRTRFASATETLRSSLDTTVVTIGTLEKRLLEDLSAITGSADMAASEASDAAWTLQSLQSAVGSIDADLSGLARTLNEVQRRLAYVLEKMEAEDPIAENAKSGLRVELTQHFKRNGGDLAAVAQGMSIQLTSSHAAKLTGKQTADVLGEVALKLLAKDEQKRRASEAGGPKTEGHADGTNGA